MFIYWGYPCGGKRHMKKYAHINNKTYLMWCHHGHWIRKRKVTTNYYENDWSDETIERIYYHKHKNYDNLRTNKITDNKIHRKGGIRGWNSHPNSILTDKKYKEIEEQVRRNKKAIKYSLKDIKKYTHEQYLNTQIYHDILCRHNKIICEQNLSNEILYDYYDEIFDGVDLVTHPYMWTEAIIRSNVDRLRSSNNIVPYKSDIISSYKIRLEEWVNGRWIMHDGFLTYKKNHESIFDADKNNIWEWLDEWNNDIIITTNMLKKYNIPYQMFDLDNDNYKDTFGWDIDIPRDYSYNDSIWNNDSTKKIEDIAKEYITLRKL
tara:strand:+ start:3633 stop:4592 length:960 start_codon:yes stop_codon:yes gene_type:complete